MPAQALIVLGAGVHATSVCNVARSAGYEVFRFVDPAKRGTRVLGVDVVGEIDEISDFGSYPLCIAVGDNSRREIIREQLRRQRPVLAFPSLIHSSATVSWLTSI